MIYFTVDNLLVRKITTLLRRETKIFKITVADTENYCLHDFFIGESSLPKTEISVGDILTIRSKFDDSAYLKDVEIVEHIKR